MSDKKKCAFTAPAPKSNKLRRPSTVTVASSSRAPLDISRNVTLKENKLRNKPSTTQNTPDLDTTLMPSSNFDEDYRQIAYGKFLRSLLQDCIVDDKIERDKTDIDIAMAQLFARFERSVDILDKTSKRLQDINFTAEQKRLADMKRQDFDLFYEISEKGDHKKALDDLLKKQEPCLDQLETKNIDFGYNKETGHKQLLDAVNEALRGFDEIKRQSKLDPVKIEEYDQAQEVCQDLERSTSELEALKKDFDAKFPKFSESLMMDLSQKVSKLMDDDYEDEGEE